MTTVDMTKGIGRRIWACAINGRRINGVSVLSECLFWRLHLVADDYGNFPADPQWLKANAMPRRAMTPSRVSALLDELADSGIDESPPLVIRYSIKGQPYASITNFEEFQPPGRNGKRVRKYPPPAEVRPDASKVHPDSSSANHVGPVASKQEQEQEKEQEQEQEQVQEQEQRGPDRASSAGLLAPSGPESLPPDASLADVLQACRIAPHLATAVVASGKVTAFEVRAAWAQTVEGTKRSVRPVRDVGATLAGVLMAKCGIQAKPKAHIGTALGNLNSELHRLREQDRQRKAGS